MSNTYRFPGHLPFVEAAGESLGASRESVLVAAGLKPVNQAASLISQAPYAPPASWADILAHAEGHLSSLKVAVASVEAMVAEAKAALLPEPPAPEPEPRRPRRPKDQADA